MQMRAYLMHPIHCSYSVIVVGLLKESVTFTGYQTRINQSLWPTLTLSLHYDEILTKDIF